MNNQLSLTNIDAVKKLIWIDFKIAKGQATLKIAQT